MKKVDARGLPCPQPVVNTKKALEEIEEGVLTVIVDNLAARDNVKRFAESQGCCVEVKEKDGDFYLDIVKGYTCRVKKKDEDKKDIIVYICSDKMGIGDEELGRILIRGFFKTLFDIIPKPTKMIFINSGVRLTTEGSEVMETIKSLETMGVQILSCGTCLDFYGLKDKLQVGIVSNMYDIVESLIGADRIISP